MLRKILIILALFISLCTIAYAFSLGTTENDSGATDAQTYAKTFAHDGGTGSNRILIVFISGYRQSVPTIGLCGGAITYGGDALSLYIEKVAGTDQLRVEMWTLLNPKMGSNTVSVTCTTAWERIVIGAVTVAGVNQTTPFRNAGVSGAVTGTTPSLAIGSAIGDLVIAGMARLDDGGAQGCVAQDTSLYGASTAGTGGDAYGSAQSQVGAASVTINWATCLSSQFAALAGDSLEPATTKKPTIISQSEVTWQR